MGTFHGRKAFLEKKAPGGWVDGRREGAPLAFAGLWESWRDPVGEVLRTFATTAANDDVAVLHERMPMILEPAAWPLWLGEEAGDYTALPQPAAVGVVRL